MINDHDIVVITLLATFQADFIAEQSRALNCGQRGPVFESRLGTIFSEFVFQVLDVELS